MDIEIVLHTGNRKVFDDGSVKWLNCKSDRHLVTYRRNQGRVASRWIDGLEINQLRRKENGIRSTDQEAAVHQCDEQRTRRQSDCAYLLKVPRGIPGEAERHLVRAIGPARRLDVGLQGVLREARHPVRMISN